MGRTDPPSATSQLLDLYRAMRLVREAEERLGALFADGEIPGFIHLSIGQEAVSVGVAAALEKHDTLASNHRGHGHAIAKGLDLDRFFLEILGKQDGYCRGRGGSMHVADMTVGMLGANGIVGAGAADRRRQRPCPQAARHRPHRRRLLRRRRDGRGRVAREPQSRPAVDAAGPVRVREQRLVGIYRSGAPACHRPTADGGRLQHARAQCRRQ